MLILKLREGHTFHSTGPTILKISNGWTSWVSYHLAAERDSGLDTDPRCRGEHGAGNRSFLRRMELTRLLVRPIQVTLPSGSLLLLAADGGNKEPQITYIMG